MTFITRDYNRVATSGITIISLSHRTCHTYRIDGRHVVQELELYRCNADLVVRIVEYRECINISLEYQYRGKSRRYQIIIMLRYDHVIDMMKVGYY